MLRPNYTPRFKEDVKRLEKKHVDLNPLKEVMQLVLDDTPKAKTELRRRHNMHVLKGDWRGSLECHVANAGGWLLIWATSEDQAYFQRTGSHDELLRDCCTETLRTSNSTGHTSPWSPGSTSTHLLECLIHRKRR